MVLASVRLTEDVVLEGPPCHIKSVTQLMDTERIARSMIEFLKSGKLFLQGYIRQILGLANDLHMMLQLLQAAGDGIEFSRRVSMVGRFDRAVFFAPLVQGALRDVQLLT